MQKDHILIGKTINKILLADDKEAILFITTGGDIKAKCDADCCSHTWIEGVEMPVNGLPATVASADDIPLNDHLDSKDGELKHYGFKIVTDKGDIVIDFRNESNGYYGGSLSWPGDSFYGGVYSQNESKEEWKEITA